jgi:hypothetical protein
VQIPLRDIDADFLTELRSLLATAGEDGLALQVESLSVVDRCRCGDDFCATFYSEPRPRGAYGAGHRNVVLSPEVGMLILDVVNERIVTVEVLYNDVFRERLLAACL